MRWRENSPAGLPARDTATLIICQAAQRGAVEPHQRGAFVGIEVIGTEPVVASAAANHSVLISHDAAARGAALGRNEHRRRWQGYMECGHASCLPLTVADSLVDAAPNPTGRGGC